MPNFRRISVRSCSTAAQKTFLHRFHAPIVGFCCKNLQIDPASVSLMFAFPLFASPIKFLLLFHDYFLEFPELSDGHAVEISACGAREKSAFDVSPDSILHHPAGRIVKGDPVDELRGFPPTDSLRNLFKPSLIVKFPKRAQLPICHRIAAAFFSQLLLPFLLPELFEQFFSVFPVRLRRPLFQKSSRCKRLQLIHLPVRGRADRHSMLIGGVFRFRFDLAVLKFQQF